MAKSSGTKERLHGPITYLFDIPIYWCGEDTFNGRDKGKIHTDGERERKPRERQGWSSGQDKTPGSYFIGFCGRNPWDLGDSIRSSDGSGCIDMVICSRVSIGP